MVDVHTHALPNLDDGAKDTATAVAMLQTAVTQGVDKLVFTPHYYGKRRSPVQFLEQRNATYAQLQGHIPENIQTYLGAEVHFTGVNMPPYEELCKLSIADTKYILIEFPFVQVWSKGLLEKLTEFMYETGYTPLIAHVERYPAVWKKPALLAKLTKLGCLIQVNAGAFLDKKERKLAFALLKHGFVHCIGTDCHDMDTRAPQYALAKTAVEQAGFASAWEEAQTRMNKLLAGEQVCVECKKPVKKFLWKYI